MRKHTLPPFARGLGSLAVGAAAAYLLWCYLFFLSRPHSALLTLRSTWHLVLPAVAIGALLALLSHRYITSAPLIAILVILLFGISAAVHYVFVNIPVAHRFIPDLWVK